MAPVGVWRCMYENYQCSQIHAKWLIFLARMYSVIPNEVSPFVMVTPKQTAEKVGG